MAHALSPERWLLQRQGMLQLKKSERGILFGRGMKNRRRCAQAGRRNLYQRDDRADAHIRGRQGNCL